MTSGAEVGSALPPVIPHVATGRAVRDRGMPDQGTSQAADIWWRVSLRAIFAWAVIAYALARALIGYARTIPRGGDAWMAGDWLINYGDGFVRRGLFGHLFLSFAPGGQDGLWLLFALQCAGYAVVVIYLAGVLQRTHYSWSSIALVCAPAGLTFIGWDTFGGFRKEIIAFVVLALLAWSRRPGRSAPAVVLLVTAALGLWTLAVFSWEASALLAPAVLYLLWVSRESSLVVFRRSAAALFAAVGAVGAAVSALAHGDASTSAVVCETVRQAGFLGTDLCGAEAAAGGGIGAIGWTTKRAIADVTVSFPLYVGFLPLIALALAPILASRWFTTNGRWALAIALGVLPLYFLATDYGRWTHILVLALTFCITAADPEGAGSRWWNPLSTILYVTLWAMPHHLSPDSWWDWLGLAAALIHSLIAMFSTLLGFPVEPGFMEGLTP